MQGHKGVTNAIVVDSIPTRKNVKAKLRRWVSPLNTLKNSVETGERNTLLYAGYSVKLITKLFYRCQITVP